ncbi:prepilin peptidase [Vibrio breoganii]|uniref:A24 family peptidase n=1 Tax=Vibrio breoganii TaxID=553239 RepID=UPI000C825144|nr:A24 family peptidase [Vibrio breoganii]PMG05646.1 hypothetical protein BCV00_12650 [Vibrio breoganii]
MFISLFYWALLFTLALYDLREHRIPNVILVIMIVARLFELLYFDIHLLLTSLQSGCILFGVGLALFVVRAMSPGDVKLLFVIGFITGISNTSSLLYWILIAGGVVALFCYLHRKANVPVQMPISRKIKNIWYKLITIHAPKSQAEIKNAKISRYGDKLVMPFAPSIVIGLAMFYYFN